jgi:hypothetical protein
MSKHITSKTCISLCEICLSFREGHKLRIFENRALRRIVRSNKRDEVTGSWKELHIEELNDLYSPVNIARIIKARRMGRKGQVDALERGAYSVLVGKHKEIDH